MIRFPAVPAVLVTAILAGCQILPPPQTKTSEEATGQTTEPVKTPDISVEKPKTEDPVKHIVIHEKVIQIPTNLDGRLLLGVAENGFLPNHNLSLKAKMDTGAAISSIDARGYQLFERDGKKWVKFDLHRTSKGDVPMEYPVKEIVRIKRPGEEAMSRPVIEMTIRIGNVTPAT